jgi:uncharacterized membrane protein YczE
MTQKANRVIAVSTLARFVQLIVGLAIYGVGIGTLVDSKIGIAPWDVFAQGIAVQTHLSFGLATVVVSALVMVAWIPLKQRPGIGTVLNAVLIGVFADIFMPFLPKFSEYTLNLAKFLVGLVIVAFATGMYISTRFGPGPRDGLVVGTQKRLGWPFWLVRTAYEGTVLTVGWLMGGQVREGTVIFAVCIGYLMQLSLRAFGMNVRGKK